MSRYAIIFSLKLHTQQIESCYSPSVSVSRDDILKHVTAKACLLIISNPRRSELPHASICVPDVTK